MMLYLCHQMVYLHICRMISLAFNFIIPVENVRENNQLENVYDVVTHNHSIELII